MNAHISRSGVINVMSTTTVGREAEGLVASKLEKQGYKLVARNWRTRFCEIDLVMTKDDEVYFIEVKYRSSDKQGSGLEYITPKKLHQMRFAAGYWLTLNNWNGNAALIVAQVSDQHVVTVLLA